MYCSQSNNVELLFPSNLYLIQFDRGLDRRARRTIPLCAGECVDDLAYDGEA